MLDNGLTTFAEVPDPTRSDCHAWSASPVYFFLSLVCGIKPAESGFRSVWIETHPGRLNNVEASMPHPAGTISLSLKRKKNGQLAGIIILPEAVNGVLVRDGKQLQLKGGINKVNL